MFRYSLKEIFGDAVPDAIGEEELRVTYQIGNALDGKPQEIRKALSEDLELPMEVIEKFYIDLGYARGHVVTLEMQNETRLHIINLDIGTLLDPNLHRKIVAHELSHLFRIATKSTGENKELEEQMADTDGNTLKYDFGNEWREKYLAALKTQ